MAKIIEEVATEVALAGRLYNLYELVEMTDEFDKKVKIKKLKDMVSKGGVKQQINNLQIQLDELNDILSEVLKVEPDEDKTAKK
jgi:hypothetical protein